MPTPLPTQIAGAEFLGARTSALLADAPRCGKTGAALMACDVVGARSILIVTTSTNRLNFARDVRAWQTTFRSVGVLHGSKAKDPETDVVILSWSLVASPEIRAWLIAKTWDVLILDEAHYAKNHQAQRTRYVYGVDGLWRYAARVWLLTGTPIPNAPIDLWPALHALEPGRLREDADKGWPLVKNHAAFLARYCTSYPRMIGGRRVEIVTGGKNEDELRARLDGWWLRRTQADVGIQPPRYDMLLLPPSRIARSALAFDQADVLAAAEAGETKALDMHLGSIRRLTGAIKADAVIATVLEEFECGLDSIVLMAWHQETIDRLAEGLSHVGCVCLSGATTLQNRQKAQDDFQSGKARVFIGQMQAAGEAIDLSRAANLIFVEHSFTPSHMAQAALRITNHGQKRSCLVRAAVLAGSIDEAVTAILLKKVASIKAVWSDTE